MPGFKGKKMKLEIELTENEAFNYMFMLKVFKSSWADFNPELKRKPEEETFINVIKNQIAVLDKIKNAILENIIQ